MDGPRVFDGGSMTLVMGPQGASIYAGIHQIKMFNSVTASVSEDGTVSLEIKFGRSHDPEVERLMDEGARLASKIPGVTVIR